MDNSAKITDAELEEMLNGFKSKLTDNGYAFRTITGYVRDAKKYLRTGLPITKTDIKEYFDGLKKGETNETKINNIRKQRVAALRYCDYVDGNEEKLLGWKKYFNIRREKRRCNEDCFNCIYPDCIMY